MRITLTALLTICVFCTVLHTSCKKEKDPCAGINCLNGGKCNGGKCVCPTGFEGTYCDVTIPPDPCKSITCLNGGTCDKGKCSCPTGYEGTYCESKSRDKFLKTWSATDANVPAHSTNLSYLSAITARTTIEGVRISNFSDNFFTHDVIATVSGNIVSIPLQEPDNDGYSVVGSGTYNKVTGKISWTYTLRNPSFVEMSYEGIWQ